MDERLSVEETPDGLQVHYAGRALYGSRPRSSAVRRVDAREIPPGSLVLWLSPGVWHGADELIARAGEASTIVAVEADPVLASLSERTLQTIPIRFVRATAGELVGALRDAGVHRLRRVIEVTTSGGAILNRERYRDLVRLLDREIRVFWQNRLTLAAFGRLWLRNTIRNLPRLADARPIVPVSQPAFVCGAGPSLDEALSVLERVRGRVLLVCVDTALPVLHAHGLRPDLVVALEGQLANVYDFLTVPTRAYRLIADLSSAPAAIRLHEEVSWTATRFAPVSLLERLRMAVPALEPLHPYGSVGVAAVAVAMRAASGPVFTAGLDFAVRRGSTHARGAPAYRHALVTCDRLAPPLDATVGARLIRLPGTDDEVLTTLVLKGYAEELQRLIVSSERAAFAVAPFGLPYGARSVSPGEAVELISGLGSRSARPDGAEREPGESREAKERLLELARNELGMLERAQISTAEHLPVELDYLACEIPDLIAGFADPDGTERIVPLPLTRAGRARLAVVRDYYLGQWDTTTRRLEATLRRP